MFSEQFQVIIRRVLILISHPVIVRPMRARSYLNLAFSLVILSTSVAFGMRTIPLPGCAVVGEVVALSAASGDIHYQTYGIPSSEATILIHGLGSSAHTFETVGPKLGENGFTVAYDQRGHRFSKERGMSFDSITLADDLKNLMQHLGITSANLVGVSLGAKAAIRFAQMNPEKTRSLTIVDMEAIPRGEIVDPVILLERAVALKAEVPLRFTTVGEGVAALGKLGKYILPANQGDFIYDERSHQYRPRVRPYVSYLYSHQGNREDLSTALETVKAPVWVLRADPMKGSAIDDAGWVGLEKVIPQARRIIFTGVGHNIPKLAPEKFVEAIERIRTWK